MDTTSRYRDINPSTVVVACMPDHTHEQIVHGTIWTRRFLGVKVGDNLDGTIRVQVSGNVPDLRRSVFRRRA